MCCSQKLLWDLHDSDLNLYSQHLLYLPYVTLQIFSAAVILQCLHLTKLHVTHSLTYAVFTLICIVFFCILLLTLP
jgi:hypothetical protein